MPGGCRRGGGAEQPVDAPTLDQGRRSCSSGGPGQRPGQDESLTRGPDVEGVQHFAIVIPEEGASVSIDSLEFLWRSEGPEVHYLLTVTDENGDIVWTGATRDTSLAPPREAAFSSDETYYWYVDALLEGASSSTTGVREFSIRP